MKLTDTILLGAGLGVAALALFKKADADPDPDPDGMPPFAFNTSRGVNYMSPVLRTGSSGEQSNLADIQKRMDRLKADKHNFLRIPFYWDHYIANPEQTLIEVERITREAGRRKIWVQWDNHHFHTGAYNGGDGFPDQWTEDYPLDNTIDKTSDKAWRFWQAYVYNEIPGIRDAQWQMMDAIFSAAARGNEFGNWIGIELLNEPQVPPAKLGETNVQCFQRYRGLYEYFATRFRQKYGNKQFILVCEANGIGGGSGLMPPRNTQHTCFPKVTNLAYAAHRYNTPLDEEFGQTIPLILNNARQGGWDVKGAMIQEWALGGSGLNNSYSSMTTYMGKLKQYDLGWTYWAAFSFGQADGRVLYLSQNGQYVYNNTGGVKADGTPDTGEGEGTYFQRARQQIYGY